MGHARRAGCAAMTGRANAEWIASHPDQAIPKSVKLRIWTREDGRCYLSGLKIQLGDKFEYEHKKPLWAGGEHRETNIYLALKDAHAKKTAVEAKSRAKADRVRAKHLGIWPPSKQKIKSRGFEINRGRRASTNTSES